MKKLFFFLILMVSIGLNAQIVYYPSISNNSLAWDSIRIPVVDTFVIIYGTGYIAQYNPTITFKMTGLDSSVIVHPGGTNSKTNLTGFNKIMNDSFPATLSRLYWVRTENGVQKNIKSYPILTPLGFMYFGFYLKNSGCTPTSKYLKYQVLFTKP